LPTGGHSARQAGAARIQVTIENNGDAPVSGACFGIGATNQLAESIKLIWDGALLPIVERAYPFSEAQQALTHVEAGRTRGESP
jgi:NADPH:quinone reductase-like Zn-dependent oxidoreductase